LLGEYGSTVERREELSRQDVPLFETSRIIPEDDHRLLRLSDTVSENGRHQVVQRLDRLAIGGGTMRFSGAIGRQAITWGSGLFFQVNDLVSPFAPGALDKDYKPGEDMLFSQYMTADGGEVQAAAVARRELDTQAVSHAAATYAARRQWIGLESEATLMAAHHYGRPVFGASVARDWRGAVWRLEANASRTDGEETVFSGLANLDRFWTCWERTCYGYVEYYRNGFGVADGSYERLDEDVLRRLERGDLFAIGRDYLAFGGSIEWTPRLSLGLDAVWNLNDGSNFNRIRLKQEVRQDFLLSAGVGFSTGGKKDEFSGVPLGPELAPQGYSEDAYLRFEWFF